jgi:hypothetical protein
MPNLIPEKRLNKNNVLVTRHVRPADSVPSPGAATMPAPSIYSRSGLLALREEIMERVEDHDESGLMDGGYRQFFREGLVMLDADTALAVRDFITSRQTMELAIHLVADNYKAQHDIRDAIFYRDAMPLASELCDPGVNYADEIVGQIRGVRRMHRFEDFTALSEIPPESVREVDALLRVGYAVYKGMGMKHEALHSSCQYGVGSQYPLRLVDQDLIDFTLANTDRAADIAALIREGESIDIGWLEQGLRVTPSLIDGAL